MRLNYNNLFAELFSILDGILCAALAGMGYKGHKDIAILGDKLIAGIVGFCEFPWSFAFLKARKVLDGFQSSVLGAFYGPDVNTRAAPGNNGVTELELIDKGNDIAAILSGPGAYNSIFHRARIT